MSAPAWTPGPWADYPSGPVMRGYSQPFAVGQIHTPNLIAGTFGDVDGGSPVAAANARLIAAAPDLVEALQAMLAMHGSDIEEMDARKLAQAALTKAGASQ